MIRPVLPAGAPKKFTPAKVYGVHGGQGGQNYHFFIY
jgi:hypothetical protein